MDDNNRHYKNLILEEVFNQTNQFIGIMENDMTLTHVNKTLLDYINLEEEEIIGLPYWELPLWSHSEELQNKIMFSIERIYLGESVEFQTVCPNKNGEMRDIDFYIKPVFDDNQEIVMLITMGYDVTEVKRKESALQRAERELKMFFEYAANGFFIKHLNEKLYIDMESFDERIDYIMDNEKLFLFNDALLKHLDIDREQLIKKGINKALDLDRQRRREIYMEMLQKRNSEFSVHLGKGEAEKIYECTFAPIMQENLYEGSFGVIRDITEKKKIEKDLIYLATKDFLTGIDNRRNYLELIKKKMIENKSDDYNYVMLMIDIDNFKKVNDHFGHDVGDKVLVEMTKVTQMVISNNGYFGRMGGEEFSAFLFNKNGQAYDIAEEIRKAIASIVVNSPKGDITLTVSIGFTEVLQEDNVDTALKRADEALYEAKNSGKNKVVIYGL